MVTNRKINISGSYISCGKESSLTFFGKRTVLNRKNIGPKFCFRSMWRATANAQTRLAVCESAHLSQNLLKNSRTMLRAHDWKNVSHRGYATRAEFNSFEEQHGYEIKKIVSPDTKADNHFQFKNKATGDIDQLTHAKMSEGKANNDNPIVGPGTGYKYNIKNGVYAFFQRIVKNPGFFNTREVLEKELESVDLNQWKYIPDLLRIKRQNPQLFQQIQIFFQDFHKYPMKTDETHIKSSLLIYFFETFCKMQAVNQEIKENNKKK